MQRTIAVLGLLAFLPATTSTAQGAAIADEHAPSTTSFRLADGTGVELRRTTHGTTYRVRTADGHSSGTRTARTDLHLQWATFDPLDSVPEARLAETGRLRIIQFETEVLAGYLAALAADEITVHRDLPDQAVLASLPDPSEVLAAELQALPYVRWVGSYPAEARFEPRLLDRVLRDELEDGPRRYRLQVLRRGLDQKRSLAAFIEGEGGRVEPLAEGGFLMEAHLDPALLVQVAGRDEVLWIEPWEEPRFYMDKVRADGGADRLETELGFTGRGVRGEVFDLGLHAGHGDLQRNPILVHKGFGSVGIHGTEVTGIVFGTGDGLGNARGLLPDGQGIFSSVQHLGDRYAHTVELLFPPFEAVFQTNSWGFGPTPPSYPSVAFELDDIVFLYDLLVTQAMANEGTNRCEAFAWAKNVVSVGGIRHRNTADTADDVWSMAGSIGPAQDGRIKPDLSYWYDSIFTIQGMAGYTSSFGGTSAATPEVAGHFGLFFQMWHEEVFGNVAPGATVFESRPRSATARAMLLNQAQPYDFFGASHDLTRVHQGWGRASVSNLLDAVGSFFVVNEERLLRPFETASYRLEVAPGQPSLRATLVFKDLPGTSSASRHTINDLSLRLTSPSGVVFWGNQGLETTNFSLPGGSEDHTNTVEQVWTGSPEAGTWTVDVIATSITRDAHAATPEADAPFALVVAGVVPAAADLGGGLAGTGGAVPTLTSRSYYVGGSRWALEASGLPAGAPVAFVIGDRNQSAAFLGGVLVPDSDITAFALADGLGRARVEGDFRTGIPADSRFFVQAWAFDPGAPQGASATNALEIRTP